MSDSAESSLTRIYLADAMTTDVAQPFADVVTAMQETERQELDLVYLDGVVVRLVDIKSVSRVGG